MQQLGSQKVARTTGERYQCTSKAHALGNVSERSCLQTAKQYPMRNICFASSKLSVGKMRLQAAHNFQTLCKRVSPPLTRNGLFLFQSSGRSSQTSRLVKSQSKSPLHMLLCKIFTSRNVQLQFFCFPFYSLSCGLFS